MNTQQSPLVLLGCQQMHDAADTRMDTATRVCSATGAPVSIPIDPFDALEPEALASYQHQIDAAYARAWFGSKAGV